MRWNGTPGALLVPTAWEKIKWRCALRPKSQFSCLFIPIGYKSAVCLLIIQNSLRVKINLKQLFDGIFGGKN